MWRNSHRAGDLRKLEEPETIVLEDAASSQICTDETLPISAKENVYRDTIAKLRVTNSSYIQYDSNSNISRAAEKSKNQTNFKKLVFQPVNISDIKGIQATLA